MWLRSQYSKLWRGFWSILIFPPATPFVRMWVARGATYCGGIGTRLPVVLWLSVSAPRRTTTHSVMSVGAPLRFPASARATTHSVMSFVGLKIVRFQKDWHVKFPKKGLLLTQCYSSSEPSTTFIDVSLGVKKTISGRAAMLRPAD